MKRLQPSNYNKSRTLKSNVIIILLSYYVTCGNFYLIGDIVYFYIAKSEGNMSINIKTSIKSSVNWLSFAFFI